MKYQGCLLAVTDMSASKHFYKTVRHQNKEYPREQRDIRVYDPDKHIVEIAENMAVFCY